MPFGHTHGQQEEVYVVVDGSAKLKLDDDVVELKRWDAVRIAPDTVRNVEAGAGRRGADPDRRAEDDAERRRDDPELVAGRVRLTRAPRRGRVPSTG